MRGGHSREKNSRQLDDPPLFPISQTPALRQPENSATHHKVNVAVNVARVCIADEERVAGEHLEEHGTERKHVLRKLGRGHQAQQDFRRLIPLERKKSRKV